jgi:hypothetical protein
MRDFGGCFNSSIYCRLSARIIFKGRAMSVRIKSDNHSVKELSDSKAREDLIFLMSQPRAGPRSLQRNLSAARIRPRGTSSRHDTD